MSYVLAFGADAACGANSSRNPATGKCRCNAGYDWVDFNDPNNADCKPGCSGPNTMTSPVDKRCHCTPGFTTDKTDACTVRSNTFPDCVDMFGHPVPGCVMGYSPTQLAPFVIGGVAAGAILTLALGALFRR